MKKRLRRREAGDCRIHEFDAGNCSLMKKRLRRDCAGGSNASECHAGNCSLMKKRLRQEQRRTSGAEVFSSRKLFADEEAIETKPLPALFYVNLAAGNCSLMKKRLRQIHQRNGDESNR